MNDRRPSGMPGDRVFPGAPGFDYQYESEVAEASVLIRKLRRTMLVAAAVVVVLVAVFLVAGNGDGARGVMNLLGTPVLFVLLMTEVMAYFHRRRTRSRRDGAG